MAGGIEGVTRREFLKATGAAAVKTLLASAGPILLTPAAFATFFGFYVRPAEGGFSRALSKLAYYMMNAPVEEVYVRQQGVTVHENRNGSTNSPDLIERPELANQVLLLKGPNNTQLSIKGISHDGRLYLVGRETSNDQEEFYIPREDRNGRGVIGPILRDFFRRDRLGEITQVVIPSERGLAYYALLFDRNRVKLDDLNGPTPRPIDGGSGDVTEQFINVFSRVPPKADSTPSMLYVPQGNDIINRYPWQRVLEASSTSSRLSVEGPIRISQMFPTVLEPIEIVFTDPARSSVFAVSGLENRIDGGLSDYWDGTRQSGAVAEIRQGNVVVGRTTTDNEGRFSFGDLRRERYDVRFRQPGRVEEAVNIEVSGNTDLRWTNAGVNEPMDLFTALFVDHPYGRSVRFRDPKQLDYQIVTDGLPPEVIRAAKLLIRAGAGVPENSIQEISANPRYGPGTFVVQLSNDSLDNLLPQDSVSVRIMALEGDNITDAVVVLKPELFTTFSHIVYITLAKEIEGAIKGVIGDPDPYLGHPIGIKYQNRDFFISRSEIPEFEDGMRGLLSRGRIDNPRNAVYPIYPIVTQKVLKMADQRSGGQVLRYFDALQYLYSTTLGQVSSSAFQRQGLEETLRIYVNPPTAPRANWQADYHKLCEAINKMRHN